MRVYKAPPADSSRALGGLVAKLGIPLPVMPSWEPTAKEWESPDAVFRFLVTERGQGLQKGVKPPCTASLLRARTLSVSKPPSLFLPHTSSPGGEP